MSDLFMNAYWYSFDETGERSVDEILSAVARAGKGYHNTEYWSDPDDNGVSCIDQIQGAAAKAADESARLRADLVAAHALLGEWLAIPVENDAYADLRTRTRELLDRGA